MTDTQYRLSRARTHLLLDHPWFGSLALRLKLEPGGTETMSTNGSELRYNEEYVAQRSDRELVALMAHEVMHCALLHPYRGKNRDWQRWNEACDLAVNPLLRAEGFALPPHPLENEEPLYIGMTAEQIYAAREQSDQSGQDGQGQGQDGQGQGQEGQGQDGQGQGQSNGLGNWPDIQPAPQADGQDAGEGMSETDWQIATEQATAVAKKAGQLGSNLDRALEANRRAATDWRTILRRFIEQMVPSDYSWLRPNRRYLSEGLYLPGMVRENTPRIGVAVDTSGSIGPDLLERFAKELTAILHETRPERVDVVYCDYDLQAEESFSPDDAKVVLHAKGGGGTRFQPALTRFSEHEEGPPACVIYLTDLEGPAPNEPHEYPVLWAVPEWSRRQAPFGELVQLSRYE